MRGTARLHSGCDLWPTKATQIDVNACSIGRPADGLYLANGLSMIRIRLRQPAITCWIIEYIDWKGWQKKKNEEATESIVELNHSTDN